MSFMDFERICDYCQRRFEAFGGFTRCCSSDCGRRAKPFQRPVPIGTEGVDRKHGKPVVVVKVGHKKVVPKARIIIANRMGTTVDEITKLGQWCWIKIVYKDGNPLNCTPDNVVDESCGCLESITCELCGHEWEIYTYSLGEKKTGLCNKCEKATRTARGFCSRTKGLIPAEDKQLMCDMMAAGNYDAEIVRATGYPQATVSRIRQRNGFPPSNGCAEGHYRKPVRQMSVEDEQKVISLILIGKSDKQIAWETDYTTETIKETRQRNGFPIAGELCPGGAWAYRRMPAEKEKKIVNLILSGKSDSAIVRETGVSRKTVYAVRKRNSLPPSYHTN